MWKPFHSCATGKHVEVKSQSPLDQPRVEVGGPALRAKSSRSPRDRSRLRCSSAWPLDLAGDRSTWPSTCTAPAASVRPFASKGVPSVKNCLVAWAVFHKGELFGRDRHG